jgi:hypothetical protein
LIAARTSARPALTADSSTNSAFAAAPTVRAPLLDCRPQRRALAQQVLLADELVERARPHPHGQRLLGERDGGLARGRFGVLEQGAHPPSSLAAHARP